MWREIGAVQGAWLPAMRLMRATPGKRRARVVRIGRLATHLGVAATALTACPAMAQDLATIAKQIASLRSELNAQRQLIDSQSQRLAQQQAEIERLRGQPEVVAARSGQLQAQATEPNVPGQGADEVTGPPVGSAPDLPRIEEQVRAVPEGLGVLTRGGHFVLDPSLEYTNSSSNRLVFRGIELIPGIQVGLIEASNADRDTIVATTTLRYGLTDTLEVEARVPYLVRSDRADEVQQRDSTMVRSLHLREDGLGDVEFALRYQINRPVGQRPIFVGSLRVKSDTGKSPFSVPFDEFGVATGLATGSGFWAVQPGVSFLLPSDPAVIFGGASYLYQAPRNIDRMVGGVLVGRVDPGDAINANIGFGFALNPRFSFSLAYQHNYIFPMRWIIGGLADRSRRLQVGSFAFGMSYRLTERQSVNLGIELGATRDAPDLSLVVRAPLAL